VALTAYFDESGTHGEKSPAVLVGGFVTTEVQWTAYEGDLKHLFSRFGVKVFHAEKFRKRRGEFKDWSDNQFLNFGTSFFDLFEKHLGRAVAFAIRPTDYKETYRAEKFPVKGRQDSIYGLCFRFCLLTLIEFAKNMEHEWPLSVILESGHKNAGNAVQIFDEVKSKVLKPEYKHLLGTIDSASKATCPRLASADAMVHTFYQSKVDPEKWQKNKAKLTNPYNPYAAGLRVTPRSRIQLYTVSRDDLAALRKMTDSGIIVSRIVGRPVAS
jgi:hypothetical protein